MTVQPPPPPSGPPGPPGPWSGPPPGARPPGLSNTARFWIGFPVGLVVGPVAVIGLFLVLVGLASTATSGESVALFSVVGLVVLGLLVAGLVVRVTRWFVLGAVAGFAVAAIVLGGACVAIIQSLGG